MQQQHRAIVHMDLDTFFVSCERLTDSRLIGKPILIGGTSDRGVVASCSYEARQFGIHSAMPMKLAIRRCPEAIVISGNSETYSKYSRMITDIVKEAAPVYEKSSIDEFYIDLSGMDKFFGCLQYAKNCENASFENRACRFLLACRKTKRFLKLPQEKPNRITPLMLITVQSAIFSRLYPFVKFLRWD